MQEEYCTLDPITRKLTLTEPQRIAGVESDEYARGLKFKFPKTVDSIDLTQMQLRINFMNSRQEKGQHIVTDMKPMEGEEGYITFTWPFSRLVTHYRGYTKLVVCAVKTDENGTITAEWNTALAQMRVLEGLEVDGPEISPEEKDVISQLISICQNNADEAALSAQQAQEAAEKVLNYGPKIGANGNWIVGGEDTGQPSQGFSPTVQTKPIDNGTEVVITDKNSEKSFEVKDGKDGEPGAPGKNGTDGKTPNIQIGTVETLPAGSKATASITGDPENPLLSLGIPEGATSAKKYELIETVNITEDGVTVYEKSFDNYYTDIIVSTADFINYSYVTFRQIFNGVTDCLVQIYSDKQSGKGEEFRTTGWGAAKSVNSLQIFKEGSLWKASAYAQNFSGGRIVLSNGVGNHSGFIYQTNKTVDAYITSANKIKITCITSGVTFLNPTTLYIMGVRE